jgi:hypothetical protein
MIIIEFHGSVKTQGAVAVGSSAVLGSWIPNEMAIIKIARMSIAEHDEEHHTD